MHPGAAGWSRRSRASSSPSQRPSRSARVRGGRLDDVGSEGGAGFQRLQSHPTDPQSHRSLYGRSRLPGHQEREQRRRPFLRQRPLHRPRRARPDVPVHPVGIRRRRDVDGDVPPRSFVPSDRAHTRQRCDALVRAVGRAVVLDGAVQLAVVPTQSVQPELGQQRPARSSSPAAAAHSSRCSSIRRARRRSSTTSAATTRTGAPRCTSTTSSARSTSTAATRTARSLRTSRSSRRTACRPGRRARRRRRSQSFTPDSHTLLMNPGDKVRVHIFDPPATGGGHALEVRIDDLTTGQSGFMQASAHNGYQATGIVDCSGRPFNYEPEYSTATKGNIVPWAALGRPTSARSSRSDTGRRASTCPIRRNFDDLLGLTAGDPFSLDLPRPIRGLVR